MELEVIIEREPAWRWVSALVVTLPVLACVACVTWFIRANVSPPTIQIPSSPAAALLADPGQVEPTPPIRAEASAETPTAPAQAFESAALVAAPAFPAPWSVAAAGAAPASGMTETAPVAIPLPQPSLRPTTVEMVASTIPLSRPRPPEESAARQPATSARQLPGTRSVRVSQPTYARHGAE